MTEYALSVEGLYKAFGPQEQRAVERARASASRADIQRELDTLIALRDITFSVGVGEIFMLMGLSGSGKSTLLRCLNRLHEATAGRITIDERDLTALSTEELRELRRSHVGMVFQHFGLFPQRTVRENVGFGLELRGWTTQERDARCHEVLSSVGLSEWADKRTCELSGGMQQRVGLARALAIDPQILLMDEPFSALDPLIRTGLQEELRSLHQRLGKTIIFVTHDLNEAIRLGDRIAILGSEGQIVQIGTPEEILLDPADEYVRKFLADVDRPAVIRVESVMDADTTTQTTQHPVTGDQTLKEILGQLLTATEPLPVTDASGTRIGTLFLERTATFLTS
ncbi:betaine/proline/choline family ABC transporter ATP-binding protein [Patescibacteria group bacterium]|jgi:glycine betaine/proline transport system ATP-binding protein|nr:betaine/proline/choline family ABC transporter ATP-binding protein [Patescibacteria group bacterium]